MKCLIIGDTHGQTEVTKRKIELAKVFKASIVFVVGDFGLWPGEEGVLFLDRVNEHARRHQVRVIALPGNHEDHDQWDKWFDIAPIEKHGFAQIRSNIFLTKMVHPFKMGGKRFYVCGGAVSIDRQWRVPGESWWPNEIFSEDHLASVQKYNGPAIDYMLTHDCSDFTPFGFNLVPDPDSQANRKRIDKAIAALKPRMQFHGHMHCKYEWLNTESHGKRRTAFGEDNTAWNGHTTATYGLDREAKNFSTILLDTEADTVKFV